MMGCKDMKKSNSSQKSVVAVQLSDSISISLFLDESQSFLRNIVVENLNHQQRRYDYEFDSSGYIKFSEVPIKPSRSFFMEYKNGLPIYSAEIKDSLFNGLVVDYEVDTIEEALQQDGIKYYSLKSEHDIYARPSKFEVLEVSSDTLTIKLSHDRNSFEKVDFYPYGYRLRIFELGDRKHYGNVDFKLRNEDVIGVYKISISKFERAVIISGRYFAERYELEDDRSGDYFLALDTVYLE